MKYTRIRVEFENFEDRFNRVILVKGNPDLFKLAAFLAFVTNSEFNHFYEISTDNDEYVRAPFLSYSYKKTMKYLKKYSLNDLPNDFVFLYDSNSEYKFNCHKEETLDINSRVDFILESAIGQGIWEDNSLSLIAYLNGHIDPLDNEEYEEYGITLPWNFDNVRYGEFDDEIDIKEFNEDISKDFPRILNSLKRKEKSYIERNYASLDDVKASNDEHNRFRLFEEWYMMIRW